MRHQILVSFVCNHILEKHGCANRRNIAELPAHFLVWLASPEAYFLKDKFIWVNWDAEELLARADEIQSTKLLNWIAEGVPM